MAVFASETRLVDLAAELRRVADSPYTPSLQNLYDVLHNVDSRLLLYWVRGNACQIETLVATVLEGLELWPFALDILRILSCIPLFRDAVLRQEPMLLDTLINKAVESDSAFDKYAATCVSLLSLPVDLAIPSRFPDFLMELVAKAVRSLSPETIRPIYHILSAVGSSYLDMLSFDMIARLQDRLVEVLTKLDMDDHFGDILCLGVLAKLAAGSRKSSELKGPSNASSPIDESSPRAVDRYVSARKLFEVKRAPKTLDLAVIRAITACSESCTLSPTEISESLKLSGEIVDAFDFQEKQAWMAKNSGKVKKLHKKMLRKDIDSEIQCGALNFLVILSDGQHLPRELVPVFEKLLLTSDNGRLSARAINEYITQLDQPSTCDLLLELLGLACESNPDSGLLAQLASALHLVDTITGAIPTAPSLRETLCFAMSSKRVERTLQRFTTQLPMLLDSVRGLNIVDICPGSGAEALYRLHQDLTVMLLSAALHASLPEQSLQSSLRLLLEKQTRLSNTESRHGHCNPRKPILNETSRVSLFEARSTPQVDSISHDWRTEIVRELSRDAGCRYESLVRTVGEVCRDLEIRCTEAERPLREEQSRSQGLRAQLEAAQLKIGALEKQSQSRGLEVHSLTHEKNELLEQVRTHKDCMQDLGARLDNIRQEFDQAKADAEHAAQTANENARQQDLAYLATLTGKDQIFEEQSLKLATSQTRVEDLECEISQLKAEAASDLETTKAQQEAIEELKGDIATAKDLSASLEAKIDELQKAEKALISRGHDIVRKAQEESQQHESTIYELRKEIQAAKVVAAKLEHRHDINTSAKEAEILRLEESLRSSNEKWHTELNEACNNAVLADEQNASTIASLQGKIKALRKEREERAREFSEAQELSTRLMAVMGITRKQDAIGSTNSADSGEERGRSSSSKSDSPDPPVIDADSSQSFNSSTSDKSGPTPQRSKRRRSLQYTCNEPPITRISTRSAVRQSRVPLADLGSRQNRPPVTPTQLVHGVHSHEHKQVDGEALRVTSEQQDSDDESFGGGDILANTDQQRLSALDKQLPRSTFDETTMEF